MQLRDLHHFHYSRHALHTRGIVLSPKYTSLSRAVWIKYIFLNRSNVKKVHDRLYYLENGGRSVCGTAAIVGQQRPASPEKKKVLFLFKHLLLSHLICYIHWGYFGRSRLSARIVRYSIEWSTTEPRSVGFRLDGKIVCTQRESGSLSRTIGFLLWWFTLFYDWRAANRCSEFRPSFR